MIKAKLNVSKINKDKLFHGEKGVYLDIVLFETPNGKYGDWMIVQDVSREEREAGVQGAILGNGTNFQKGGGSRPPAKGKPQPPVKTAAKPRAEAPNDDADDVPF